MPKNTKQTSKAVTSLAARTLQSSDSSATARRLAASALSQTGTNNQTGSDLERLASNVMTSSKYSDDTKTLAASVLAQANKFR